MNKGEIRLTENEAGEFLTVLKVVQHAHDNDNFLNPSWCKRFADVIKLLESKLTTAQASEGVCDTDEENTGESFETKHYNKCYKSPDGKHLIILSRPEFLGTVYDNKYYCHYCLKEKSKP